MAKLPPTYHAVIVDQQQQLAKLIRNAGVKPVKKMYERMLEDLTKKLDATASGTFTHQQLQGMMGQVKLSLGTMTKQVAGHVKNAAADVGVHAGRQVLENAAKLEHKFTGAVVPLPTLQIGRLQGLVQDQTPSLMRVHETSMRTFGKALAGRIETELASSLSMAEDQSRAIERVADVADLEWWRAERIVRTELSYSANAGARVALEEQAEDLDGDMWMMWSEHVSDDGMPLDDRVGVDSEAMHGQVAPPGGMFTQPPTNREGEEVSESLVGEQWACPPNRPHDRAVLVPWRVSWGVPGWIWRGGRRTPVTEAMVTRMNARWMRSRGREPDPASALEDEEE